MSVSVFWWHQQSVGCYLICFLSYLQLFFSFVLLLGKLVWILNICGNVSILSGQPTLGASSPLFLKAERSRWMPNCSQNADVVGTPLTTLMAALLAHSWGSAVDPVIRQKVMLNLYGRSCFLPQLLSFQCLVLSLVTYHVVPRWHQNGPASCLWAAWICDLCGLLMCEDGLTMGVFLLAQKREGSTHFALKKFQGKGIVHSFWNLYKRLVLAK